MRSGVGGNRREVRSLVIADADAGIGDEAVAGRDHVAGFQRGIQREIDRGEADRLAAVAGAVGTQRLAIGERVFAVGVALAGLRSGAVDRRAEIDLVVVAGQNARHIWAGEARPRISGKYLPSQVRTQKAGPEPPAAAARVGGTYCGFAGFCWLAKGSAKEFDCCGTSRCGPGPLHSAEEEVEQAFGRSRGWSRSSGAARLAATSIARRAWDKAVRNAHSDATEPAGTFRGLGT